MADKATYSALQKKLVEIPAFNVATVDYLDTQPNYFRVQNNGDGTVYCATSHIPTRTHYDFIVNGASIKMFAEPFYRSKLYIFNPTGNPINVTVLSFRADFDPLALALSDLEIDLSSKELEATSTISGFETSLPEGYNHIGKVEVENQKDYQSTLDVIKGNQKDYTNVLASILTAIGNISGGSDSSSVWTVDYINTLLNNINNDDRQLKCVSGTAGTASYTDHSFDSPIKKIHTVSNDGENNIMVKFTNSQGSETFTLKAGEVLNDIDCNLSMISVVAIDSSSPYRIACSVFS